jgi:Proteolysis_6 C-terminal
VLPKPITFTRLPAAYTTLHAQVKELAPYEFPAICMTCSQILDAGGTGQVTAHCRVCSADGGAAFLLQESVILLLHGDRASYFPSPYIDENGERGKLSRGKPLLWDDRRGALLNTLYAQHELGKEVMLKRTSSQRVIIANHY